MAASLKYPQLLVLVRHGQSLGNAVNKIGHFWPETDDARRIAEIPEYQLPLTDLGRSQARDVGQLLKTQFGDFDKCYDSGYLRAVETRRIALETAFSPEQIAAMNIRSELLLRERESGLMHRLPRSRYDEHPLFRECFVAMQRDPFMTRPINGESIADVCDRLRQFRSLVLENHGGKRVLVFCHGIVMKAFEIMLQRMDVAAAVEHCKLREVPNCQIHAYRHDGDNWEFAEHTLENAA